MKNKDKEELTGRESMVMKCVWDHDGDISAVELQTKLKECYGVEYERSTIGTFLLHLREKGYLDSYKIGQIYYYRALVDEKEYANKQVKQFTDFWFNGSLSQFITAFTGKNKKAITPEEIQKIRRIIDELDE